MSMKPGFERQRQRLPSPESFLSNAGIKYRQARNGKSLQVFCPIHKSGGEKKPSLSMDKDDGHYKCFTCGIKGKDIIHFYMDLHGLNRKSAKDFIKAVKALGAWNEQ